MELLNQIKEDYRWSRQKIRSLIKNIDIKEKKLVISFENKASFLKTLIEEDSLEDNMEKVARAIKENERKFDYFIISLKSGGYLPGAKIGPYYIKQMHLNDIENYTDKIIDTTASEEISDLKREFKEIFSYIILRKFLGTKSPLIDLIQDKNGTIWICSTDLSQAYQKNDRQKSKKFSTLEYCVSAFDKKSAVKLFILAVLLRLNDLKEDNLGILQDNEKGISKLGVVDFCVFTDSCNKNEPLNLSDEIKNVTNQEEFINLIVKQFNLIKNNFAHRFANTIENSKSDLSIWQEAFNSIASPLTENVGKKKKSLISYQPSVFKNRSHTFEEAIGEAYNETISIVENLDYEKAKFPLTKLEIKEVLANYRDGILNDFSSLNKTFKEIQNLKNYPKK